jgi:hypothetical protein
MNNYAKNRYFVCIKDQPVLEWNPCSQEPMFGVDQYFFTTYLRFDFFTYLSKAFAFMENNSDIRGIKFYLVWNDVQYLPSYGEDIVVFSVGDESSRFPKYFNRVKATFKCYGTEPTLGIGFFSKPSYLYFLTLIHFARNWLIRFPSLLNYFLKSKILFLYNKPIPPIYDIPLGYANQLDLPIKKLDERVYDVSFLGSVSNVIYPIWSLTYWLKTPKQLSREKMCRSLKEIIEKNSSIKVQLSCTSDFGESRRNASHVYSENLMNTKICLVPRGTTWETCRFFEAIRYGCITITEALPSRWFYDDCPVIKIRNWKDLEKTIDNLLSDQEQMHMMSQRTLDWWHSKCSESALGYFIAQKLSELEKF